MSEVKERDLAVSEISCLNEDCMLKIFEYLPVLEIYRVARVSKSWKHLSRESLDCLTSWEIRCVDTDVIFFEKKKKMCLKAHYESRVFEEFLIKIGKFVSDLRISTVQENLNYLKNISENCIVIKLELINVNLEKVIFLKDKLKNIEDLTLRKLKHINKDGLLEYFLTDLKLKSLHIHKTKINGQFLRIQSLTQNIESLKIEESEFTNSSFAFNTLTNYNKLMYLSLSASLSTDIDTRLLINLIQKPSLKKLDISWNYFVINDDFLVELARHAHGLTELQISGNNVSDRGLNAVTNLPNLVVLPIKNFTKIEGEVDVYLPNLKL